MQVNVVKESDGSWEVHCTVATQVLDCPDEHSAALLDGAATSATGMSLTKMKPIDYDKVQTQRFTLAAFPSLLVPNAPRDLPGVYEVHDVTVLGLTSVFEEDMLTMLCCGQWKKRIHEDACPEHPKAIKCTLDVPLEIGR